MKQDQPAAARRMGKEKRVHYVYYMGVGGEGDQKVKLPLIK